MGARTVEPGGVLAEVALDRVNRPVEERREGGLMRQVGRNDPCPCGSGKKYKKCCLSTKESLPPAEGAPEMSAGSGRLPYATEEHLRDNPLSPVARMEAHTRDADGEAAHGHPERTYDLLKEALACAPSDGDARNALQELEELCMNHAVLYPRGPEVSGDLEKVNLRMGARLQAAQAAAERADFLEKLGRGEDAAAEYRGALAEYAESTWLRLRYARFLADRGEREKAEAACRDVLSMPDEEHAHEEARNDLRELATGRS